MQLLLRQNRLEMSNEFVNLLPIILLIGLISKSDKLKFILLDKEITQC